MKSIYFDVKPGIEAVLKHCTEKNRYFIMIDPDHKKYCDLLRKYGHSSNIPDEFTGMVFPLRYFGPRNDSEDNYRPIYDEETEIAFNQLEFELYSGG